MPPPSRSGFAGSQASARAPAALAGVFCFRRIGRRLAGPGAGLLIAVALARAVEPLPPAALSFNYPDPPRQGAAPDHAGRISGARTVRRCPAAGQAPLPAADRAV